MHPWKRGTLEKSSNFPIPTAVPWFACSNGDSLNEHHLPEGKTHIYHYISPKKNVLAISSQFWFGLLHLDHLVTNFHGFMMVIHGFYVFVSSKTSASRCAFLRSSTSTGRPGGLDPRRDGSTEPGVLCVYTHYIYMCVCLYIYMYIYMCINIYTH